jgi:GPH family glycoside/pentoside/hexuronide:cation symporter
MMDLPEKKPKNAAKGGAGRSTVGEMLLYGLGDVGCNFIWTFASSFLVLYYTDSAGIAAAYVGTMMLVSRILDGVSDILMGVVIEKTRTRWGKARPWILFGSVPFALSLILLFNVPAGFSGVGKNTYVFLTYVFMSVFCYTVVNLAYHATLARFSLTPQDRTMVTTVRVIMVTALALVLSIITPALLELFGGQKEQRAWNILASIYAALALGCLIACFLGVREKVPMTTATGEAIPQTPLKEALRALLRNKYFCLAAILSIVGATFNVSMGGYIYYARDVLGNVEYFGLMSMATMAPLLAATPLMPHAFKKLGKRGAILVGMALGVLASVVQMIAAYNLIAVLVCMALRSLGITPLLTATFTFPGDIVDYMEWKDGIRTEGLVSGTTSFGSKVGTGLGSAILGWLLALGNYNPNLPVQAQATLNAEIMINVGVPCILSVICFVVMLFWDIDKYRPQIDGARKTGATPPA